MVHIAPGALTFTEVENITQCHIMDMNHSLKETRPIPCFLTGWQTLRGQGWVLIFVPNPARGIVSFACSRCWVILSSPASHDIFTVTCDAKAIVISLLALFKTTDRQHGYTPGFSARPKSSTWWQIKWSPKAYFWKGLCSVFKSFSEGTERMEYCGFFFSYYIIKVFL
jgi:hypothetical protein